MVATDHFHTHRSSSWGCNHGFLPGLLAGFAAQQPPAPPPPAFFFFRAGDFAAPPSSPFLPPSLWTAPSSFSPPGTDTVNSGIPAILFGGGKPGGSSDIDAALAPSSPLPVIGVAGEEFSPTPLPSSSVESALGYWLDSFAWVAAVFAIEAFRVSCFRNSLACASWACEHTHAAQFQPTFEI